MASRTLRERSFGRIRPEPPPPMESPQWFLAQPSAALRTPNAEPPRLHVSLTTTAALSRARRLAAPRHNCEFRLAGGRLGRPADSLIGPVVSAGQVLKFQLRIPSADDGELSVKVFAVPVAESWYLRSAGIILWEPRRFHLRDDPELHGIRVPVQEATVLGGPPEPTIAGGLQPGHGALVTLDRVNNMLRCDAEDVQLAAKGAEDWVPIIELGALSDAKWATFRITDSELEK
mmetsp:Transcript_46934/g.130727  ORF Transcript_46934/g.130727 Transcript_46934/m.130727 type:complete len:232 (-) Transcript_46934:176-871(-)